MSREGGQGATRVGWQPKTASDAPRGASEAFPNKTFESFITLGKQQRCEGWRDWREGGRDDAEEVGV